MEHNMNDMAGITKDFNGSTFQRYSLKQLQHQRQLAKKVRYVNPWGPRDLYIQGDEMASITADSKQNAHNHLCIFGKKSKIEQLLSWLILFNAKITHGNRSFCVKVTGKSQNVTCSSVAIGNVI